MLRRAGLVGMVCFAPLVLAPRALAAGVVGSGTPGSCTEAAFNAALSGGGTVTFNCGPNPVTIPISAQKTLTATTTVDGGNLITLDGGSATRIFLANFQVALTVRNLTLQNARTTDFGAAIRISNQGALTVTDSRFYNNVCTQAGPDVGGGAIYALGANVTVQRSTFSGNRGGNGGAIGNLQTRLTIEDSVFSGNSTNAAGTGGGHGGVLYVDGSNVGTIAIRRSVFDGNTATALGGVIHNYMYAGASLLLIEDSLFRNNTTYQNGGAIYHQNGNLSIDRSTFTGNQTSGQGGALWLLETWSGTISNSTFTANRANGIPPNMGSSGLGGAILMNANNNIALAHLTIANNFADWVGGGICGGSTSTLRGSIVAYNNAANGGNPWNIGKSCCTEMIDAGGNLQLPAKHPTDGNDHNCTASITIADPLLLALGDNGGLTPTMATAAGSPARERLTSGCPPPGIDQRGVSRPQGAGCDAGAYEALEPTLTIADASRAEGNAGSAAMTFTVTLSEAASEVVTVAYATSDVSATAGSDYSAASGTVTFPIGVVSRPIDVSVLGDALNEADDTLQVTLSTPSNASLSRAVAVGTILNDDPLPALSVSSVSLSEGSTGTSMASLTVSLSVPSGRAVGVDYATSGGTATPALDYGTVASHLDFAPGVTSLPISVPVFGDALLEPDETLAVALSGAQNATLPASPGGVTILNDDLAGLSVNDISVGQAPLGTTPAIFTVSLSPAASQPVTVDYTTVPGTAGAGSDYVAVSGPLGFAIGETTKTVEVTVNGDLVREPNKTFMLHLQNANGAGIARADGQALIVDHHGPDWNADGRTDLVFRHALSGRVVMWLMNGLVRQSGVFTTPDGWPDLDWQVVGTPDLDADGQSDLLWRRQSTGELRVWSMNGTARNAELVTVPDRLADTHWRLQATGDFNGDGRPDLVWRHDTSGRVVVWIMEGAARRQGAFTSPDTLADLNWRLAGTGDFNADNRTDLLWQNGISGNLVVWLMNGLVRTTGTFTSPSSVADPNWSVQTVADLNADGKPDLLWRQVLSGKLVAWLMDGTVRTTGLFTSPDSLPDLNWRVVGPK